MRLDLSLSDEKYSQWFRWERRNQNRQVRSPCRKDNKGDGNGGTRHCSDWGQHPLPNPACDDTPRKSCQVQSLTQQLRKLRRSLRKSWWAGGVPWSQQDKAVGIFQGAGVAENTFKDSGERFTWFGKWMSSFLNTWSWSQSRMGKSQKAGR